MIPKKKTIIVVFSSLILGIFVGFLFVSPKVIQKQESFKMMLEKKIVTQESSVTLLAFGDLMLDRYVRKKISGKGENYPFENIEKFLQGNDLILANLEGSFTDFPPKPLHPDNMIFTFDPKLIPALKRIGFNLFNLANNHTLNFGEVCLSQSKRYLTENKIDYFGDPKNENEISIIKTIKGQKIGFVGYNESGSTGFNKIIEEIKEIKEKTDFGVVYAHWGVEYQASFSQKQQQEARKMVDAGADVVIGSHPHVIQPIEIYKNKIIFYSLGNFLFDQTFSQKTQQGLGVKLVLSQSQAAYFLFPTEIKNMQINLLDGSKKDLILREIAGKSLVSEHLKKQILEGKISFDNLFE